MTPPGLVRRAAAGAVRGVGATVAMSVPVLLAPDAVMGRRPPKHVAVGVLHRLGVDPGDEGERNVVSLLAHFGFGASMGSLFSVARSQLKPPGPALVHGLVYGACVWAVSYKGWIPALGILPPPDRDRPGRQGVMLLAHLIYGGVLGVLEPPA